MTITNIQYPNLIAVLRLPECFDKVFSVLDDRDLHQYSLVNKNAHYQRELFFRLRLQILKGGRDPSSSPYKVDRLFEKIEAHVYARFSPDIPSHYAVCWKITDVFRKYDDNRTIFSGNVTVSTALHISEFEATNQAANNHALTQIWPRLIGRLFEIIQRGGPNGVINMSWAEWRETQVRVFNQLDSILPASDAQQETIQSFFNDQSNISLFTNLWNQLASLLPSSNANAEEIQVCLNHPTIQILLEWVTEADLLALGLKTVPHEINLLRNLTHLDLYNNALIIPPKLNKLQNLTYLNLSRNRLIALPELNHLQNLTYLNLSNNRFNDITNLHLKKLHALILDGLELTEIPSLDHFPNLESLEFSGRASMVISDEVFQKMPHLINMFFESEIRLRCQYLVRNWWLSNEDLSCPCESSLALLWQSLNRKNFSIEEIKRIVFNALTEKDRNLIYEMVWDLGGKVMDGDLQWGEHHAFDNDKLFRFALAVQLAILKKLDNLSQEQKNRVYGEIYKLAGSPETTDDKWGQYYALVNPLYLADALARIEK